MWYCVVYCGIAWYLLTLQVVTSRKDMSSIHLERISIQEMPLITEMCGCTNNTFDHFKYWFSYFDDCTKCGHYYSIGDSTHSFYITCQRIQNTHFYYPYLMDDHKYELSCHTMCKYDGLSYEYTELYKRESMELYYKLLILESYLILDIRNYITKLYYTYLIVDFPY
jgi:hypothetical protein